MSMTIDIVNMKGEKVGDYTIDDASLEFERGSQAVHDAVVCFLSECRAGTASTKTRGEVSGSGKKPFKQKGLGRARAGSARNPVWRHGGQIFGPKPRDFSISVNPKVKKLALKRSFSERLKASNVIIVDSFTLPEPKTKLAVGAFKAMKADGKVMLLTPDYDDTAFLATGNIPTVFTIKASLANTYQVLWADKLVFTKTALDEFLKRISD